MRSLAIAIGVGWFWLLFYGVGPLNSAAQLALGAGVLLGGCALFALWGVVIGMRHLGAVKRQDTRCLRHGPTDASAAPDRASRRP